ncbi:MAG: hypothetical protein ACXVBE_03915 [Bdellovibrionota bacterium]
MKFSYYFYLSLALLALAQYSYHKYTRLNRAPVPVPYVPDKLDIKYRAVKEGFQQRAKYLSTKDPD